MGGKSTSAGVYISNTSCFDVRLSYVHSRTVGNTEILSSEQFSGPTNGSTVSVRGGDQVKKSLWHLYHVLCGGYSSSIRFLNCYIPPKFVWDVVHLLDLTLFCVHSNFVVFTWLLQPSYYFLIEALKAKL